MAPSPKATRGRKQTGASHTSKAPVLGFGDSVPAFFSIAFTDVGQAAPEKGKDAS